MDAPRIDERSPHLLTMLLRARGDFWETPATGDVGNFTTAEMAAWTAVYRGISTSAEARAVLDELIQADDRIYADETLFTRVAGMVRDGLTYVQLAQELTIPLLRDNLLVDTEIRAENDRRAAATTA